MTTSKRPFQLWPKLAALGIVLVLCGALAAFGQGNQQDTTALFKKVAPAIVTIFTDNSGTGGGYVVDAATGLVATNFHVIAPARRLTVTFPYSKDDRKKFPVEGFVAVLPGRDLALIRIKAGEKKLQSLRLAEKLPKAGEPVYGINSPTADPSYAEGRVAAIRSGQDISDLVVRLGGKDYRGYYEKLLGYDLDATWIQHTAPTSAGSSGAPLLNSKGEVVGVNTWFWPGKGPRLRFAISSTDLAPLLVVAGTKVHPLSELDRLLWYDDRWWGSDREKTLASWLACNKAMIEFNGKIAAAEKERGSVPAVDPKKPAQEQEVRRKALSAAFTLDARACLEFADELKGLAADGDVNSELAVWTVKEGALVRRTGHCYQELAALLLTPSGDSKVAEAKLASLKEALDRLRAEYDVLQRHLSRMSRVYFLTAAETENAALRAAEVARKLKKGHQPFRTWTSRDGKFRTEAKLRGLEDGKAVLELKDGKLVRVPFDRLSEADQQFVDEALAPQNAPK